MVCLPFLPNQYQEQVTQFYQKYNVQTNTLKYLISDHTIELTAQQNQSLKHLKYHLYWYEYNRIFGQFFKLFAKGWFSLILNNII
jgi:hypothetical protein